MSFGGAASLQVRANDVLEAAVQTLLRVIAQRPLDLGACLDAICNVSDTISKAAGGMFDAVAQGKLRDPPPCPQSLVRATPFLLDFLAALHCVTDDHARVVENLAVNLLYKIVLMASLSETDVALRESLIKNRYLMFLLNAARMQLRVFQTGRAVTEFVEGSVVETERETRPSLSAHPSFLRLPAQRDYLTKCDDYIWLTCLILLKLGSDGLKPFVADLARQEHASGFVNALAYSIVAVLRHCVSQILNTRFSSLLQRCEASTFPLESLQFGAAAARKQDRAPLLKLTVTAEAVAVILTVAGIIETTVLAVGAEPENLGALTRIAILQAASTVSWMALVIEFGAIGDAKLSQKADTITDAAAKLSKVVSQIRFPQSAMPQIASSALTLASIDAIRSLRDAQPFGLGSLVEELLVTHCVKVAPAAQLEAALMSALSEHDRLLLLIPRVFAIQPSTAATGEDRVADAAFTVFQAIASTLLNVQRSAYPNLRHEMAAVAGAVGATVTSTDAQYWQNIHRLVGLLCEASAPPPSTPPSASEDHTRWLHEHVTDVCDALWLLAVFHHQLYVRDDAGRASAGSNKTEDFGAIATLVEDSTGASSAHLWSFLSTPAASTNALAEDVWDDYESWAAAHVEPQSANAKQQVQQQQPAVGKKRSLAERLQDRLMDVASQHVYNEPGLSRMSLDRNVQNAIGCLDELIALCLHEGRRVEAAAYCEAYSALLAHTNITALVSASLLSGAAALLRVETKTNESLACGLQAMKHTSLLTCNLQQRAVIERALGSSADQ